MTSGRPRLPHRDLDGTLNGIWLILRTGALWNQLPERCGKWNSAYPCFRRWRATGLWDQAIKRTAVRYGDFALATMLDASHIKAHQDAARHPLLAEAPKLGETTGGNNTKLSALVNCLGLVLNIRLVCGNEHDIKRLLDTLYDLIGGSIDIADKDYDTGPIRDYLAERRALAAIPPKSNRKEDIWHANEIGKCRLLGIPSEATTRLANCKRTNFFSSIKRYRRIATRHDRLPKTYLGFVKPATLKDGIESDLFSRCLDAKEVTEKTLVIYQCDNEWAPTSINKDDRIRKDFITTHHAPSTPPFELGIPGPIIFSKPGSVQATRSSDLAYAIDLMPTVLYQWCDQDPLKLMIRYQRYDVLVLQRSQPVRSFSVGLYKLEEDPQEQKNLAQEGLGTVGRLRKKFQACHTVED